VNLLEFCIYFAAGFLGGSLAVWLGGLGEIKMQRRMITDVQDQIEVIDRRITTEVKRRAGQIGVDRRESTPDGILAELAAIGTQGKPKDQSGVGQMVGR
jgi:hypothetical protein